MDTQAHPRTESDQRMTGIADISTERLGFDIEHYKACGSQMKAEFKSWLDENSVNNDLFNCVEIEVLDDSEGWVAATTIIDHVRSTRTSDDWKLLYFRFKFRARTKLPAKFVHALPTLPPGDSLAAPFRQ